MSAIAAGCGAERADPCARAGFSGGSSAADGVFFAAIPRACSAGRRAVCAIGDGSGPIVTRVVDAGVVQDCVAFNEFVGSGLNQIPDALAGECFGRARVEVEGRLASRTQLAPRHCTAVGPRSRDTGPPPAPIEPPARGRAAIDARAPDPWGRAPETGAVGASRPPVPPWAVLIWHGRSGATCYEPGQLVDDRTPGRSDELPGVKARGRLRRARLVGVLRYDSRSGVGIQLYGLGRFTDYPRSEGGGCGDPSRGAGLLLSRTTIAARPDLTLGQTVIAGIAGPRVRRVALVRDGRRVPLAIGPRRAFIAVLRRNAGPRLPVRVEYRDGRSRMFTG